MRHVIFLHLISISSHCITQIRCTYVNYSCSRFPLFLPLVLFCFVPRSQSLRSCYFEALIDDFCTTRSLAGGELFVEMVHLSKGLLVTLAVTSTSSLVAQPQSSDGENSAKHKSLRGPPNLHMGSACLHTSVTKSESPRAGRVFLLMLSWFPLERESKLRSVARPLLKNFLRS